MDSTDRKETNVAHASEYAPGSSLLRAEEGVYTAKRVSWGAVLAGVVLASAIQAALGVLATGIGLTFIDSAPGSTAPPAAAAGLAAAAWWIVSSLFALFFGGWAAAHLADPIRRGDGALHGVLVWAVSTVLTLYLFGSAFGTLLDSVWGTFTRFTSIASPASVATTSTPAAPAPASSSATIEQISQEAGQLINDAKQAGAGSHPDTNGAVANMNELLLQWFRGDADSGSAREALSNGLVAQAGMSREQAQHTLDEWQQRYAQTKVRIERQGRDVADHAARGVARAAWVAFSAMLLGVGAAALGGAMAERRVRRAVPLYP
jgi:hypothetical protein